MFFARGKVLQKLQAVKCPVRKARTFIIAEEINGELVEVQKILIEAGANISLITFF